MAHTIQRPFIFLLFTMKNIDKGLLVYWSFSPDAVCQRNFDGPWSQLFHKAGSLQCLVFKAHVKLHLHPCKNELVYLCN